MATDTTDPSYWLNWRFLICALYVLATMVFASFLIWKYEGKKKKLDDERREHGYIPVGVLYKDEVWKTCLKSIHPVFLLAFRIFSFSLLLALIISNAFLKGPGVFFFYTQWTFTLTTIYFGLATGFSIYGCLYDRDGACNFKKASENNDVEQECDVAPKLGGSAKTSLLTNSNAREVHVRQLAGSMCYLLQIMYQVTAGAVLLTDVVFWLVIYPFLTAKDFRLAFFDITMHSTNILILGDALLNCMRFPMFRVAYFILWTGVFVICQWIVHACVSIGWPYPFMDLSPPSAPIWYVLVGLLHIPCFGIFALIVKLKHLWLSKSFSESYLGIR